MNSPAVTDFAVMLAFTGLSLCGLNCKLTIASFFPGTTTVSGQVKERSSTYVREKNAHDIFERLCNILYFNEIVYRHREFTWFFTVIL